MTPSFSTPEWRERVLAALRKASEDWAETRLGTRGRPILGGAFGYGRFDLCSLVTVSAGLDEVTYIVMERGARIPLGFGRSKGAALQLARECLIATDRAWFDHCCERIRAEREAAEQELQRLIHEEARDTSRKRSPKVSSIPRRRKALYEKFGGKCFYCCCDLEMTGRWHIEHKLPKALGGTNDPENLVLACAPCNLKKRDKTDTEFMAARKGAAA